MPPSYSPCPRPILKRTAASVPTRPPPADEPAALLAIDPSILSPLVRFPPHQALAHTLGSAIPYDRSPIVVAPNRCALPERGCPGRTYSLDEAPRDPLRRAKRASLSPARGRHLHPRAVQEREREGEDDDLTPRQSPRADHFPLPPLVPDLSSESSEESDGIASPPPELYSSSASHHHGKMSLEQSLMHLTLAGTNAPSTSALSFLPHPPSPRVRPSTSPVQPSAVPSSYPYAYVPYASNPSSSSAHHHPHPHPHMGTTSPVRSRSPASPTRSKPRKARPAPIPIPQSQSQASSGPTPTGPASPRHLRERSRERRTHTHTHHTSTRTPRSFGDASCRMAPAFAGGFAVEDGGCLGGF